MPNRTQGDRRRTGATSSLPRNGFRKPATIGYRQARLVAGRLRWTRVVTAVLLLSLCAVWTDAHAASPSREAPDSAEPPRRTFFKHCFSPKGLQHLAFSTAGVAVAWGVLAATPYGQRRRQRIRAVQRVVEAYAKHGLRSEFQGFVELLATEQSQLKELVDATTQLKAAGQQRMAGMVEAVRVKTAEAGGYGDVTTSSDVPMILARKALAGLEEKQVAYQEAVGTSLTDRDLCRQEMTATFPQLDAQVGQLDASASVAPRAFWAAALASVTTWLVSRRQVLDLFRSLAVGSVFGGAFRLIDAAGPRDPARRRARRRAWMLTTHVSHLQQREQELKVLRERESEARAELLSAAKLVYGALHFLRYAIGSGKETLKLSVEQANELADDLDSISAEYEKLAGTTQQLAGDMEDTFRDVSDRSEKVDLTLAELDSALGPYRESLGISADRDD